jgi:Cu/Ag efflux protein CusF
MSATCDDRDEPLTLPSRFIIMIQNKTPIAFIISFAILALAFSCGPRRSANQKRYPLKGKVLAVDKAERTATIMHEDIPGFMPGMTMPFKIKNDADLEMLKPAIRSPRNWSWMICRRGSKLLPFSRAARR